MSTSFVTMNRLSAQEISFFKRQGYLIKKRHARPGTDEARLPPQLGKVEWDTSKIGQAAKFAPGSYFEAQHSSALDLGIFIHYGLGQVAWSTGGGKQNIVYKQVGKDRTARNYTLEMRDGQIWAVFASGGE